MSTATADEDDDNIISISALDTEHIASDYTRPPKSRGDMDDDDDNVNMAVRRAQKRLDDVKVESSARKAEMDRQSRDQKEKLLNQMAAAQDRALQDLSKERGTAYHRSAPNTAHVVKSIPGALNVTYSAYVSSDCGTKGTQLVILDTDPVQPLMGSNISSSKAKIVITGSEYSSAMMNMGLEGKDLLLVQMTVDSVTGFKSTPVTLRLADLPSTYNGTNGVFNIMPCCSVNNVECDTQSHVIYADSTLLSASMGGFAADVREDVESDSNVQAYQTATKAMAKCVEMIGEQLGGSRPEGGARWLEQTDTHVMIILPDAEKAEQIAREIERLENLDEVERAGADQLIKAKREKLHGMKRIADVCFYLIELYSTHASKAGNATYTADDLRRIGTIGIKRELWDNFMEVLKLAMSGGDSDGDPPASDGGTMFSSQMKTQLVYNSIKTALKMVAYPAIMPWEQALEIPAHQHWKPPFTCFDPAKHERCWFTGTATFFLRPKSG